MNRVFILGAGFSKQAGMPLATELTSLVLDSEVLKGHEEMQVWLTDLKNRIAIAEGAETDASNFSLNIEQLFDFAKFDEELRRMAQQLEPVGRNLGETSWKKADSIETWLGYMEEELFHVIWDSQKNANLKPIERLTDLLSGDDTILTFNYDTLVETALLGQRQKWNHGLNDSKEGGVTVLKMHGSIDWILLERRPEKKQEEFLDNFVKLFSKLDTNVEEHGWQPPQEEEYIWELWRAKDTSTCNAVIDRHKSGFSNFFLGFAGLGRYKPLHRLPGSAATWYAAFKALKEAEEIYVVGFSMSPYDSMARFHFTSVVRARANPPARIVVVDPNAVRLADRFHTVLGHPLTLVAERGEYINWNEVVGQ